MLKKISDKLLENKNQKNMEKEKRAEFVRIVNERKTEAVKIQGEILSDVKCPLCKNDEFWNNLQPFCYGYNRNERKVTYMMPKFGSTKNGASNYDYLSGKLNDIKIQYLVCKKCGYVIPFVNMNTLGDCTFDYECNRY